MLRVYHKFLDLSSVVLIALLDDDTSVTIEPQAEAFIDMAGEMKSPVWFYV
jgi:hypothetical protein